jgi:hypothetical protein
VTVEVDESGLPLSAGRPDGRAALIESIIETWRIDDEWWRQIISRQYFEVMMAGGKRVVLFQDSVTRDWFMQLP